MKLNKNTAKAILAKMCRESDVNPDNVFISKFGYVLTVNPREKDVDFCTTEYKGTKYKVRYLSGCIMPFIVAE